MRGDFSNGKGWAANERLIFQQASPADERFFPTGRASKREMLFQWPDQVKKERLIILRVSPGRQIKDKVFKLEDKNLIMNLI